MKNSELVTDYLKRSEVRLKAIDLFFQEGSYADVVRECQEIVELCSKALLRGMNLSVPHIHDVSDIILDNLKLLKGASRSEVEELADISRRLRRDRELSFYGSEDLTPSNFYKKKDAVEARAGARKVYVFCKNILNA